MAAALTALFTLPTSPTSGCAAVDLAADLRLRFVLRGRSCNILVIALISSMSSSKCWSNVFRDDCGREGWGVITLVRWFGENRELSGVHIGESWSLNIREA